MEILLVRFTKAQRVKIRKNAKRLKVSEAEYVRRCVEYPLYTFDSKKLKSVVELRSKVS